MIAEIVGIARREALAIDLHKSLGGEAAIRAIAFESSVPFDDGVFVKPGGGLEEVQVLFAQPVLAAFGSNDNGFVVIL